MYVNNQFKLTAKYKPMGDQPQAIAELMVNLRHEKYQTLLGVTGSGKTFTMANVINQYQKPTLILAHNKTLAAQLFSEFKEFFPDNAVHYFVSYFDYYQPEAYISASDTYIEKDSKINEEIEKLRHATTSALLSRKDVIIIASVSCIYGMGSPADYNDLSIVISTGEVRSQDKFIRHLHDIQYSRNDYDFKRGSFRVRGDVVDIMSSDNSSIYRIEFFSNQIEKLSIINPLTGEILSTPDQLHIFPNSHFVAPKDRIPEVIAKIKQEYKNQHKYFIKNHKLIEAQRLEQRIKYDTEILRETGTVKGIENYARYLTNRAPGEQPATLLDYFPDDFLMFIDESHMTIPQVRGMYAGDRARKENLVEHGFRLPSALDNRPLTFAEFEKHINQAIFVSATPAEYELSHSSKPVEQIIRPTGLLDPIIEVRPIEHQIDNLLEEINQRVNKKQRVLITTLTKRMAEDLSEYFTKIGIKNTYLHSEIKTLERIDILQDLRAGVYDVLIGINLLREGLDLPEVSLVAVMDADKEGFLRSAPALIQTIGRVARHEKGKAILYADKITKSMQIAIDETKRRREIQTKYNLDHNIKPISIKKALAQDLRVFIPGTTKSAKPKLNLNKIPNDEYPNLIKSFTTQMEMAASNLEFEKAAELRDLIQEIKNKL